MTQALFFKLLAIFATVAVGWVAARLGWLGGTGPGAGLDEPRSARSSAPYSLAVANRVLSDIAFTVFVPALLFRTMARMDFSTMPWATLVAYFAPVLAYLLLFMAWQRRFRAAGRSGAAMATMGVAATYGNSVQMGIPMASALFGESGLGLHLALVSLHGLVVLTLLTALAEVGVARTGGASSLGATVMAAARGAVLHPVTLPILLGLAWNLTGLGLHLVADALLSLLATAVAPVCLFLIGSSLAQYGLRGRVKGALGISLLKLLVLPTVVLVSAHFVFGLGGLSLAVLVMMAAAPVGSNALIFAQRYRTQEAEATAAIVLSTVAFMFTSSMWVAALALLGW
jgi:predicted permease